MDGESPPGLNPTQKNGQPRNAGSRRTSRRNQAIQVYIERPRLKNKNKATKSLHWTEDAAQLIEHWPSAQEVLGPVPMSHTSGVVVHACNPSTQGYIENLKPSWAMRNLISFKHQRQKTRRLMQLSPLSLFSSPGSP